MSVIESILTVNIHGRGGWQCHSGGGIVPLFDRDTQGFVPLFGRDTQGIVALFKGTHKAL